MITIFTTPKPFKGHSGVIQRNAIRSWAQLQPKAQIIIFGDEEGIAEVVRDLGLLHVPTVQRSEYGTPLISAMFQMAQQLSTNPLMCYVNADIMLTSSFVNAVRTASAAKAKFVMTGRRTLIDLNESWDFDQAEWEQALVQYVAAKGTLDNWVAMDYFTFPRGMYSDIPPFVVGRARWDNWMIYSALRRKIAVIDATHDLLAIHQNHDYSHLKGGLSDCFVSPEGQRNQELYGLQTCIGTVDATVQLRDGQLHRTFGRESFSRRLDTLPIFNPNLAKLAWPLYTARFVARSLRSGSTRPVTPQQF
jgi:hypothetical protein